jgi:nicotinamide riboside transporter PnuC
MLSVCFAILFLSAGYYAESMLSAFLFVVDAII